VAGLDGVEAEAVQRNRFFRDTVPEPVAERERDIEFVRTLMRHRRESYEVFMKPTHVDWLVVAVLAVAVAAAVALTVGKWGAL